MRLINVHTLKLEEYFSSIPKYTILSHTWGDEEVSFQEFTTNLEGLKASPKEGFQKILNFVRETVDEGLDYCWVDTCCIDKSSSAELSEAINSMFRWYKDSQCCYIFLSDVSVEEPNLSKQLHKSRWFTRGWTLQELIAPTKRAFFDFRWRPIGGSNMKASEGFLSADPPRSGALEWISLLLKVAAITNIDENVLLYGHNFLEESCIADKMSWAAARTTTREEDMAYCLLGLFDVNMPLLYGEGGERAFIRLQEHILTQSVDRSIFLWEDVPRTENTFQGMLAKSPVAFKFNDTPHFVNVAEYNSSVALTNRGLSLRLPLTKIVGVEGEYIACLGCGNDDGHYGVILTWLGEASQYARVRPDKVVFTKCKADHTMSGSLTEVFIQQRLKVPEHYQSHRVSHIVFKKEGILRDIFWFEGDELHKESGTLELDSLCGLDPLQAIPERKIEVFVQPRISSGLGRFTLIATLGGCIPQGLRLEFNAGVYSTGMAIEGGGTRLRSGDKTIEFCQMARLRYHRLCQYVSFKVSGS